MNNQETFVISLKDKQFLQGLINANKQTDKTKAKVNGLSGAVGHLKTAFAGLSIAYLGREVINTLADFEKFEAVLTNTLGSNSAAQKALDDINTFAAKTPFAVDKLTESYVKLANQGFTPAMKDMTKLGDLASSTGKDFDQLTEALIDGQVGEFERLKEFGIRASKSGDQVKFTFKGVQTQVAFTETAMRDYILSLGDVQGVSGAMAAISETTGGKISNLGDSVTQLYLKIGQALKPVIDETIITMGVMVAEIGNFIGWLQEGGTGVDVLTYGLSILTGGFIAYKVVVAASALWTGITTVAQTALAAASVASGVALNGVGMATKVYTVAQWALNAALTANPIGIVVVAIGALIGGLVLAWNKSEKFRAVIKGLWASIKQIGINIKDNFLNIPGLVIKAFKAIPTAISQIFSGVGELFGAIFSGDFSKIPGILEDIVMNNAVAEVGKEFVAGQIDNAKKIGSAFGEAYDKELAESAEKQRQKELAEFYKNDDQITANGATGAPKPPKGKGSGLGSGLSEIKAGAPKTFNINIESLIKEQVFQTTNLNDTKMKIKQAVTEAMLTAVNDSQIIAE